MKWKEVIGFVGMLMMFIVLVGCREFNHLVDQESFDAYFRARAGQLTFKEEVCQNQSMLMYIGGLTFFLYIGTKIFGVYNTKRKINKKMKRL